MFVLKQNCTLLKYENDPLSAALGTDLRTCEPQMLMSQNLLALRSVCTVMMIIVLIMLLLIMVTTMMTTIIMMIVMVMITIT